jgi:hypothetical protein
MWLLLEAQLQNRGRQSDGLAAGVWRKESRRVHYRHWMQHSHPVGFHEASFELSSNRPRTI